MLSIEKHRAFLFLALLTAPLTGQSEAAALKALRKASKSRPTAESLAEWQAALSTLRTFDSPRVAKALVQAYTTLEKQAGPLEAERQGILRDGGGTSKLGPLRNKLQPIHNAQTEILATIEKLEDAATVRQLIQSFLKSKRPLPFNLRLALARRAGSLSDGDLGLITKGTSRKEEDRALLLRALASVGRRAEASGPWVLAQLRHKEESIRAEAVRTLASLCLPQSLPALIEQLAKEPGRLRLAIAATLTSLTGATPGLGAHSWRLWLAKEGQPFVSGTQPLRSPGQKAPLAAEPKPASGRGGKRRRNAKRRKGRKAKNPKNGGQPGAQPRKPAAAQGTGSYFGIPQDGQSILYVFDNSKSMQRTLGSGTRISRCRAELHKGLAGLTEDKSFNLVCFANKLQWFETKMMRATKANIARAQAWIDGVGLELQTNTYDALELAFQMAGRGTRDRHYPLAADTIFFLSDGAPTRKGMGRDSTTEILAAVRRWNPLGRVMIHSIGLGARGGGKKKPKRQKNPARQNDGGPRAFLEQLAAQNGGRYVQPK